MWQTWYLGTVRGLLIGIFYALSAYQGGTVCPVTLRQLMSLALHFLMTDVTPKYEF